MRHSYKLLILTALALVLAWGQSYSASSRPAEENPALVSVLTGPGEGTYTLVCKGTCRHHLIQDAQGREVTVDLPGVANGMTQEALPRPAGVVSSMSLGTGSNSTRLVFGLREPVSASSGVSEQGLEIRLEPSSREAGKAPAASRPLGSEDLIEVNVFEVPQLNRKLRISDYGTISLPLLGDVMAAGLTPRELEIELSDLLSRKYVKEPHVSVFVEENASKKVSILGAVGKPGVFEMLGPRRLLHVLAEAGGLTEDAGETLYVIRQIGNGETERLEVSVPDLMTSRDPALNLAIAPGDVVSVPMDRVQFIYVDGAVKRPGRIEQPGSRPISLLQAMAKTGGATDRASLKKVTILRQDGRGAQISIVVNVHEIREGIAADPILTDGDVVVVPESFF